jgi:hypothetical protein
MTLQRFVTMTAIAAALAIPAATGGFAQSANAPTPSTTPNTSSSTSPSTSAPTQAAPKAAAPATAPQAARHMGAGEMRATKLTGAAVYDQADQKIGSIADLIVGADGRVTDVVIGLGDKHVGVKMADLKHGKDNRLVLNATKDALKQMASYDLNYDAAKSGSSTRK